MDKGFSKENAAKLGRKGGQSSAEIQEPEDLKHTALLAFRSVIRTHFPSISALRKNCRERVAIIKAAAMELPAPQGELILEAVEFLAGAFKDSIQPTPKDRLERDRLRLQAAGKLMEYAHAKPKAPPAPKPDEEKKSRAAGNASAREFVVQHREQTRASGTADTA